MHLHASCCTDPFLKKSLSIVVVPAQVKIKGNHTWQLGVIVRENFFVKHTKSTQFRMRAPRAGSGGLGVARLDSMMPRHHSCGGRARSAQRNHRCNAIAYMYYIYRLCPAPPYVKSKPKCFLPFPASSTRCSAWILRWNCGFVPSVRRGRRSAGGRVGDRSATERGVAGRQEAEKVSCFAAAAPLRRFDSTSMHADMGGNVLFRSSNPVRFVSMHVKQRRILPFDLSAREFTFLRCGNLLANRKQWVDVL
jgi:hypothetical protein